MSKPKGLSLLILYFSGEDAYLIRKNSGFSSFIFYLIGFTVWMLIALTFYSSQLFLKQVFINASNNFFTYIIAFLFTFLVANIFRILIYSIGPKHLPSTSKSYFLQRFVKLFSPLVFLRIAVLVLMAIMVAQPLVIHFNQNKIVNELGQYKNVEKSKILISIDSAYIKQQTQNFNEYNASVTNKIFSKKQIQTLINKVKKDSISLEQALLSKNKLSSDSLQLSEKRFLENDLIFNVNELIFSDQQFLVDTTFSKITFLAEHFSDEMFFKKFNELINYRLTKADAIHQTIFSANFYLAKLKLLYLHHPMVSYFTTIFIIISFVFPLLLKLITRFISYLFFVRKFRKNEVVNAIRFQVYNKNYDLDIIKSNIEKLDDLALNTTNYYFQKFVIDFKLIIDSFEKASEYKTQKLQDFITNLYNDYGILNSDLEILKRVNPEKFLEIQSDFLNKKDSELQSLKANSNKSPF